jgi:hypothetical protein
MLDLGEQRDRKLLPEAAVGSRHHLLRNSRLMSGLRKVQFQEVVGQIDSVDEAAPGLGSLFYGDEKWVLHRFSIAWGSGLGPHSRGHSGTVRRGLLQAGGRQSWTS